jgi:hypothetical protein
VPYLLVVGDREVEQGMLAVRGRKGEDLGSRRRGIRRNVGRRDPKPNLTRTYTGPIPNLTQT